MNCRTVYIASHTRDIQQASLMMVHKVHNNVLVIRKVYKRYGESLILFRLIPIRKVRLL